ncbi:uroplakin-2-like [Leptodactylus fuscus]|uniref:uroplakin-2-like n=1 Tax=Leptodactylus fuscus TaxID=238119 RepID=UPI003F4E621F
MGSGMEASEQECIPTSEKTPRHIVAGSSAELDCSSREMRHILWRSLLNILFVVTARCADSEPSPLLLDNYEISLFSKDRILSSVIWLKPPYCMYEAWMLQALDTSVAPRSTSLIEVQVQIMGINETYVVPDRFNMPQCRTMFADPSPAEQYVFQVGPDISNLKGDQVIKILPGTTYMIRFVLYNADKQYAYTNWSQAFKTRDLPPNPREMLAYFQGRSGGMVVITVLLSISIFLLLIGIAVTYGIQK